MRIVHEIDAEATVSVGARPYGKAKDEVRSTSFEVVGLILVTPPEGSIAASEEIHIEGNARHVLRALKDAVRQIEDIGRMYVEDGAVDPDWTGTLDGIEVVMHEARKIGKPIGREYAAWLLWEETGWPGFWQIPKDGSTPEECLRKQVREALTKAAV